MSVCLAVGALMVALAGPQFSLEWTHSVEHQAWRETWVVEPGPTPGTPMPGPTPGTPMPHAAPATLAPGAGPGLRLVAAAVRGSGAGMEPGAGAVLRHGWWHWRPRRPAQAELVLATSGSTGGQWRLCHEGGCLTLPEGPQDTLVLRPCPAA